MKTRILVLTALLIASSSALGQTTLQRVEVRPMEGAAGGVMNFDCASLHKPTQEETMGLLAINDQTQVRQLRMALMEAVEDACANNTPVLIIERGQNGRSLQVVALH